MSTWNSGGGPPPIVPRPPSRGGPNVALIAGVAAAVLAIGGGVAYFVLSPSDPDEPVGQQTSVSAQSGASEGATTEQDEDDNDRLMKVLPRGYPDGACKPVARLDGALATIACTVNKDPGGPMSATYSLLVDSAALKAAIDNLETTSTVVDCPGRIQSPVLCPTGVSKTVCGIGSARMGATAAR